MALNTSWDQGYKKLAKQTVFRECTVAESPISTVIVDVRSRLFRYIRLCVVSRTFNSKIKCVFGLLKDIKTQINIVLESALHQMKNECNMLLVYKHIYVFPYKNKCKYKKCFTKELAINAEKSYQKLVENIELFSTIYLI